MKDAINAREKVLDDSEHYPEIEIFNPITDDDPETTARAPSGIGWMV